MKIVAPLRGEFGLFVWWYVPAVHAMPGRKVVCTEHGMAALFPTAWDIVRIARRNDAERRNRYEPESEYIASCESEACARFPDATLVRPSHTWRRERFVPSPVVRSDIRCDVVVCPRRREYGSEKNWSHWTALVEMLQARGIGVFAGGASDSSFDVPCQQAWSHERFLDATIEAMLAAKLVIATDAGLAHLAVLCGRPLLMITHASGLVAPGPVTDQHGNIMQEAYWPVRMDRYREANHKGAPIRVVPFAWDGPEPVLDAALEMLTGAP